MQNFNLDSKSKACINFINVGIKIQQWRKGNKLIPFDDVMNALYEILRREQFTVPLQAVEGTYDNEVFANIL